MFLPKTRVAACHVAPVFLDARKTAQKAASLVQEAAQNGAKLVVFPESYLPAFPIWAALTAPIENHLPWHHIVRESVSIDSKEIQVIRKAALANRAFVSFGFSEKIPQHSAGCLYNSNILIGDTGEILVHHRKLMPTFYEKLIWSPGDGHGLQVADTVIGKIGALICGENTNPLARYSLMAQGEQIHIATFPPIWPTSTSPANNYDNIAANRTRAAAHSFEAKCFTIVNAGFLDKDAKDYLISHTKGLCAETLETTSKGCTLVVDPNGKQIGDQLQDEEGILYRDLDLEACIEGKQFHDVVGGYQRLDVFDLSVDRTRRKPANFTDSAY